jgi:hypothetical protein
MYKLMETASGGGKEAEHGFPSRSVTLKRDRGPSSNYSALNVLQLADMNCNSSILV